MELSKQQTLFARDVSRLIDFIFSSGYSCTLGDAFRSEEQAKIYAKEGKGIINSLHCKRLAIDLNVFDPNGKYLSDTKDYERFGCFWESLDENNKWGGRFVRLDGNHFQRNEL